ncbi:hypothetical protein LDENG_00294430, partial [Lucifuga dentata]
SNTLKKYILFCLEWYFNLERKVYTKVQEGAILLASAVGANQKVKTCFVKTNVHLSTIYEMN